MGDNEIRGSILNAYDRFWEALASAFPLATTGDLPPDVEHEFKQACIRAAEVWIDLNVPKIATATGQVTADGLSVGIGMRVEMGRAPKAGDRIWWVKARTPEEAVIEILRESEELGFVTSCDQDGEPDKDDMVPAIITFVRVS